MKNMEGTSVKFVQIWAGRILTSEMRIKIQDIFNTLKNWVQNKMNYNEDKGKVLH